MSTDFIMPSPEDEMENWVSWPGNPGQKINISWTSYNMSHFIISVV